MKRDSTHTGLSRKDALSSAPIAFPPLKTESKDDKLYVTVEFERPRWQRALGADKACHRTFGLDAYGQEIYAACDGKRSVKKIVNHFAKKHHINEAEAELNITAFLKTLMGKGLIGVSVCDREKRVLEKD